MKCKDLFVAIFKRCSLRTILACRDPVELFEKKYAGIFEKFFSSSIILLRCFLEYDCLSVKMRGRLVIVRIMPITLFEGK